MQNKILQSTMVALNGINDLQTMVMLITHVAAVESGEGENHHRRPVLPFLRRSCGAGSDFSIFPSIVRTHRLSGKHRGDYPKLVVAAPEVHLRWQLP